MAVNIGHNSGHNMCESQPPSMSSHLMSRSQELNYVEALKTHQMTRLEHIRNETTKLKLYLQTLRKEVEQLETNRQWTEGKDWAQKVSKLREDNRSLRIECHCLSMEVDLYASGQMPLGVTDENFYQNIPPGPNGPLIRPTTSVAQPISRPLYPIQQMPRQTQPPTYEESIYYPPPRFGLINNSCNADILRQVPPAPRPVWIAPSPTVQQSMQTVTPLALHNLQTPPLPPRPNSASPRPSASSFPLGAQAVVEEGQRWVCEKCTVENHPALAYCEVCEMPRNGFLGIGLETNYIINTNALQSVQTIQTLHNSECYCHNCHH